MTNGRPPLTIQDAMEELDVSDKTIRRLLKRGDLERAGEVHGRILITAESVERVKTQTPRPAPDPAAVLAYCETHTNAEAAAHFGINERSVRRIKQRVAERSGVNHGSHSPFGETCATAHMSMRRA